LPVTRSSGRDHASILPGHRIAACSAVSSRGTRPGGNFECPRVMLLGPVAVGYFAQRSYIIADRQDVFEQFGQRSANVTGRAA
jgi:hypothetical protein